MSEFKRIGGSGAAMYPQVAEAKSPQLAAESIFGSGAVATQQGILNGNYGRWDVTVNDKRVGQIVGQAHE